MAEEDDLITIVDVTDPDDPSYADFKTRRRPLTDSELANIRKILERVGAYKFFSMEFNFADGPAIKQFIDTVELEEFKKTKQRKHVQGTMKGIVAGREVIIDSDLIEKTFGLVDDGQHIIKPKGETNGLHTFYVRSKCLNLCKNSRGIYLKFFKSEYSYFINLTHQIQTYCCGGPLENQISLTQYRAIDLMIRGQPVNWNHYLLQNIQDKIRKYKAGPCALYFGGTLTALIYKALHVDYNLVNKPLVISPQTPERLAITAGKTGSSKTKKAKEIVPPKKREIVQRNFGMVTRAQRSLGSQDTDTETPVTPMGKQTDGKRKLAKHKAKTGAKKRVKQSTQESEPSDMDVDENDEVPDTGELKKKMLSVDKLGEEIVVATSAKRVTRLFDQAMGAESATDTEALTPSKDLWLKYDRIYSLQHEYQLEHIVAKQMLEQSLNRIQELEDLLKDRDGKLAIMEKEKKMLEEEEADQARLDSSSEEDQEHEEQAPLKVRLKVGHKKFAEEHEDEECETDGEENEDMHHEKGKGEEKGEDMHHEKGKGEEKGGDEEEGDAVRDD